jgi:large repetitive protein
VSKSYCGNNTAHSQSVHVALTVTDSSRPSQTATDTFTTTITFTIAPPTTTISGPATSTIAGTNCKTLTWSATTSGGTTPYSYAWKIGGVAAGTSSSTSVSKSYCGNNTAHSQSVSVTLTVTDAASQTASDTFTTTITYTVVAPAPSVSISSTTPVAISGTICKTITWTSTVSGGTSPYSYAWKIDGVAAGSASSVSKTYCGADTDTTQTVNVALTVTDAASQTGSATYTTTINYSSLSSTGGCLITVPGSCSQTGPVH